MQQPTGRDVMEVWTPYIESVGRVMHAWNRFQETLGQIFLLVTGFDTRIGIAVRHAPKGDWVQRELLRAAIHAAYYNRTRLAEQRQKKDLVWLLNKADKLAEERNEAAHVPCTIGIQSEKIVVQSLAYLGNPKARELVGDDIVGNFKSCELRVYILGKYAEDIECTLRDPQSYPWPSPPEIAVRQKRQKKRNAHDNS
jgi:hypothetical protein